VVIDWEDLTTEMKTTKDNAVIEVSEPYFITYWHCRVSMDIDRAYKAELNTMVEQVQAAKGIRTVWVVTWNHAQVVWKQEVLQALYQRE
jgi:hypothetical protein